tara:strand:+ start:99 stop:482 length:384 start_codon:yes stop_codon:yes gene_type:complete
MSPDRNEKNFLKDVRFTFMHDALPIGIGIVEQFRKKGFGAVIDAFTFSTEAINDFRNKGEPFAQSVRDRLDDLNPGLGNPVMSVDVSVEENKVPNFEDEENDSLLKTLSQIEQKLKLLDNALDDSSN